MSHPDRQPASNGGRSRVALLIHARFVGAGSAYQPCAGIEKHRHAGHRRRIAQRQIVCTGGRAGGAVPLLKAVRACFAPGLIIAVVRGEDSFVAGFGETAPGNKAEPDGQSIFRLGSVSKVFATDVLAKLVAQGHVGLTDPLSRYAPDGVVVKSFGSTPFTLLEPLTPQDCRASCAIPQSRMATAIPFLRSTPAYAPGTTAALGKAAGKPYRDLCRSRSWRRSRSPTRPSAFPTSRRRASWWGWTRSTSLIPTGRCPGVLGALASER